MYFDLHKNSGENCIINANVMYLFDTTLVIIFWPSVNESLDLWHRLASCDQKAVVLVLSPTYETFLCCGLAICRAHIVAPLFCMLACVPQ